MCKLPNFLILALIATLLSSCSDVAVSKLLENANSIDSQKEAEIPISMQMLDASLDECPTGGEVIQFFKDSNRDGRRQENETLVSFYNICNGKTGATGADGVQGFGVGILVEAASAEQCSGAGGSIFKTFVDKNNNNVPDSGEALSSVTTMCNGVNGSNGAKGADGINGMNGANGSNGLSAVISTTPAALVQCENGGVVYTSSVTGQNAPDVSVVCNGLNGINGSNGADGMNGTNGVNGTNGINGSNGQNGLNANFAIGVVGPQVEGKLFSACHHDYLYFPNSVDASRGWLTFRHQRNGSNDQGIGATGFQVWNVDIINFSLASEVGNVNYCNLNWDPATRILSYTVVDNSDGLAGQSGVIQVMP